MPFQFPDAGAGPYIEQLKLSSGTKEWFLKKTGDHCMFLLSDERCGIHAKFGEAAPQYEMMEMGEDGKHAHAALVGTATGLDAHLAWHGSARAALALSKPTVFPAANGLEAADLQSDKSYDR